MVGATVYGVLNPLGDEADVTPPTPQVPTPPPVVQTPVPVIPPDVAHLIADNAGVLTDATRSYINSTNNELRLNAEGAQIAAVTMENYPDTELGGYAINLFIEMGVPNNGMLILLITEEVDSWLTTGPGISGAFTDDMADNFWDNLF